MKISTSQRLHCRFNKNSIGALFWSNINENDLFLKITEMGIGMNFEKILTKQWWIGKVYKYAGYSIWILWSQNILEIIFRYNLHFLNKTVDE